jgi:hypothetical protein
MRELLPSVQNLFRDIESSRNKLINIQNRCKHPEQDCEYIYKSDTGNWCRADDSWWTNYKCYRCGKYWTENGSKPHGTRVEKFTN